MMQLDKTSFPEQLPSGSGKRGDPTKNCASCDCAIQLGSKKLLVPLGLVLYANGKINLGPAPTTEWNQDISPKAQSLIAQPGVHDDPEGELVDFMLSINCSEKKNGERVLDKAEIEIRDSEGNPIYHEDLSKPKKRPFHSREGTPDYLSKGRHRWQWDGYDDNNILDTAQLKKGKNKILLKITYNGIQTVCEKQFTCKSPTDNWETPAYEKTTWIDVKIDKNAKTIDMLWRLHLIPEYDTSTNVDIINLALDGVNLHWSRKITHYLSPNDDYYSVSTTAVNNIKPMSRSFSIYIDETGNSRSNTILYNIYYDTSTTNLSDRDIFFRHTAAHEIGHLILYRAYTKEVNGQKISQTHKGTSTYITQDTLADSPSYTKTISDLMWYYGTQVELQYAKAGKEDVRGAIYLAQLQFN